MIVNDNREAYTQKLKAKIDEWNAELDRLAAKADQADGEIKVRYYKQMEELRKKRNDVEQKVQELKDSTESVWDDMKQGVENSWATWKESFTRAKSEFEKAYKEGRDK